MTNILDITLRSDDRKPLQMISPEQLQRYEELAAASRAVVEADHALKMAMVRLASAQRALGART